MSKKLVSAHLSSEEFLTTLPQGSFTKKVKTIRRGGFLNAVKGGPHEIHLRKDHLPFSAIRGRKGRLAELFFIPLPEGLSNEECFDKLSKYRLIPDHVGQATYNKRDVSFSEKFINITVWKRGDGQFASVTWEGDWLGLPSKKSPIVDITVHHLTTRKGMFLCGVRE